LAVVGFAARGVEAIRMGRDVAQQVQGMGRISAVRRRGFDGAVAEAPRFIEPAEQQTGATQPMIVPAIFGRRRA
jgi:hypothetical protein